MPANDRDRVHALGRILLIASLICAGVALFGWPALAVIQSALPGGHGELPGLGSAQPFTLGIAGFVVFITVVPIAVAAAVAGAILVSGIMSAIWRIVLAVLLAAGAALAAFLSAQLVGLIVIRPLLHALLGVN